MLSPSETATTLPRISLADSPKDSRKPQKKISQAGDVRVTLGVYWTVFSRMGSMSTAAADLACVMQFTILGEPRHARH